MGLCKCPKRKVTNLFCYKHRVNVCEFCLVQNHTKCVVQSYLNWLKDSDYDSTCAVSGKPLEQIDPVRLLCYHVFDWPALSQKFSEYPANTAPGGFLCPVCSGPVFPSENQAGPVAEALRERLKQASWARVGLGLPLIPELEEEKENNNNNSSLNSWDAPETFNPVNNRIATPLSTSTPVSKPDSTGKALGMIESEVTNREKLKRQLDYASKEVAVPVDSEDPDENKYARRKPTGFLAKLIKAHEVHPKYRDDTDITQKTLLMLFMAVIGVFTILFFLTKVGRSRADHDPFLDEINNPNIHNADIDVNVAEN